MGLPWLWMQLAQVCCFLFPMDHLLFVLQSRASSTSPWNDKAHGSSSLCRSEGLYAHANRVEKSHSLCGLDNYIFYVRQSQKLEQMLLW